MNIDNFEGIQLWLGPGYGNGYEIVGQKLELRSPREHGYGRCMTIDEYGIFDGDGAPTNINNSYCKIMPDDYRKILEILHRYGDKMLELAKSASRPLERDISEGDCLYNGGYFYHVENISLNIGDCQVTMVEYNKYFATICWDDESDTLESMWDEDELDEIMHDMQIISEDSYKRALNLAKSAVIAITDYVEHLYRSNSKLK